MFAYLAKCYLLVLLVIRVGDAILISSNSSEAVANGRNDTSNPTVAEDQSTTKSPDKNTGNTTFYYEPNTFLVNRDQQKDPQLSRDIKDQPRTHFKAASVAQTSGRSGRMLDLDALVGDITASRANKERSMSGNRQSRYLSGSNLDIGPGKKLHIQGYIPIVGVKDATDDDKDSISESGSELDLAAATKHQQQKMQAQQVPSDLPYAQSSIGHASYGVQRFLNSDQMSMQSTSDQQVDAKFSGASVVDSIKRPLKRLTGYDQQQVVSTGQSSQQQNCLCVPFYMCKNGYISESSLGKSQIQQMIQQQQLQQISPKQADQQVADMKLGHLYDPSQQQRPIVDTSSQAQYADSLVPVDERSNEREIITMAPLTSAEMNQQSTNQTEFTVGSEMSLQQLQSVADETIGNSSDYSQDILGRMLGIKSSKSPPSQPANSAGACGLLRSCCNIPLHLFPSAQDIANEKFMSQYGTGSGNRYQQVQQQQQQNVVPPNKQQVYSGDMMSAQQQQQVVALQRYQQQQQQPMITQKLPYGFPSQISQRMQQPVLQPLNSPFNALDSTALAHRSTQFNQASNRYQAQPSNQVSQYTRAAPQMQQLQTFQPQKSQGLYQQGKAIPVPLGSLPLGGQISAQTLRGSPSPGSLGTRKILDGRCGLRQSAGITGRVQALQYPDSSADFGEYPAQAAILKRISGSDSLFVCGGTLISQYWIATAAHCIKKHAQGDLKIRLGEWDVHRDDEFYPFVEKEVRDIIVHPDFVAGNLVNDIALLRLDSPVDSSLPHINPACLPSVDESFARQRCWVTGWGKDSFGQKGSFQSVLREVELPVVGHRDCESALRQTRLGIHYRLHAGFICAGGEGGRDACEGDGGSGLYCIQDGVIKVAGLVSWGIGCGQAGVPGVYVSLAHYRPWIENIISIDEDLYSPYSNMIGNNLISERSNANSSVTAESVETTTSSPSTTSTSAPT